MMRARTITAAAVILTASLLARPTYAEWHASPTPPSLLLPSEAPAHCVVAGPTSGLPAPAACRSLIGADLPTPTPTTLGGVESIDSLTHNWIAYIDTSGVPHQSQPAAGDISGLAASATTDTTNASNITSGTLNAARFPSSGVTPGSYGSSSSIPVVTVDAAGRITNISTNNVSINAAAVSGLASVATSGTLTLGTSSAAANPQRSGDATTGMYSAVTGEVDIAAAGVQEASFNFMGINGQASGIYGEPSNPATIYDAYGNSIDTGTGATVQRQGFPWVIGASLGILPNSYGIGGAQACDISDLEVFVHGNPGQSGNHLSTVEAKTNDANNKGTGSYEAVASLCHQAMLSWLAIPSTYKVFSSAATQTGTWSASSSGYVGSPIVSTTNGSTLTYSITTFGGPIFFWYRLHDSDGGQFSLTVDSGSPQTITTATSPAIATNNGGTHGTGVAIFLVSAGTHAVALNVTSSTSASNSVEPVAVGTPSRNPWYEGARVFAAGVLKQQNDNLSATTAAYNTDSVNDVATLRGYGLYNVYFVDVRKYVNSTTDMCNQLHPCSIGHQHIADAFNAMIQPQMSVYFDPVNYNYALGPTLFSTTISQTGGGNNGIQNTAVGTFALNSNTTGYENTALGYGALQNNTTGFQNTAYGHTALQMNTTGVANTAVGQGALQANTTGGSNTAIGEAALSANTTGANDTALGTVALVTNTTGVNNTAIGASALRTNSTGNSNTAVGYASMYDETGGFNTALGYEALFLNTTTSFNVSIGASSLSAATAAANDVALGYSAASKVTTGANNLVLGNQVASTTLTIGNNNILIGTSSAVDTVANNTSYELDIGNLIYGNMTGTSGQVGVAIGSSTVVAGAALDLSSQNNSIILPSGTISQRPGTPANGMLRYNSSTPGLEAYYAGAWNGLGTGSGGGAPAGSTGALQVNAGGGVFGAYAGITCAAHKFLNALDANASSSADCVQPAASDISGLAASATTDTTNASNISSGTLPSGRLPNPSATTLGGIESIGSLTHNWIAYIDTSGVPHQSQPAAGDIFGLAASATTDTTNASNISSGTLGSLEGGAGAITGALKANGSGIVSQAACGDLSNAAASCSLDTTNAANISSGTLPAGRLPAATNAAVSYVMQMQFGSNLRQLDQSPIPGNFVRKNSVNALTASVTPNTAPFRLTGAPYTTGTASTDRPVLLLEPAGTPSTNWSAFGIMIGINAPSGFVGNVIESKVNGASAAFSVSGSGFVTANGIASNAGTRGFEVTGTSSGYIGRNDSTMAWVSNTNANTGTIDTSLSRGGAAQVNVGNGTSGDFSGTIKATTYNQAGTNYAPAAFVNALSASAVMANFGGL